jgi:Flp pilus assembly protein TadB
VKTVPYCPKCGADVDEKMTFCPKCGAPLEAKQPVDWRERRREIRREWRERRRELRKQRREAEKPEKAEWEKAEKYEKREQVFIGPFVGGLILIFLGIMLYMLVVGGAGPEILGASFFILVGVTIIAAAVYGLVVAGRRHPTV